MLESSIFIGFVWNGRSPRKPQKKEEEEKKLSLMDPDKIHLRSIVQCLSTGSQVFKEVPPCTLQQLCSFHIRNDTYLMLKLVNSIFPDLNVAKLEVFYVPL